MDREKKEKIAVFRFGVIFPLVEKDLHEFWGEKERILRELVSKEWEIPFSHRTYISIATILNWVRRYEEGGRKIEALFPEDRGDRGRMRSISEEVLDTLLVLRKGNPKLSTPRLVEKARAEGVFPPGQEASMASIYRLLKIHNANGKKTQADRRKFEVQMSNDLWQSDCMHGPKVLDEGKLRKCYLFAFIDDHSRLIPHGRFYLAETLENYLDCLWMALRTRGVPRKLYVDNRPSFRSHRLQIGCAYWQSGYPMPVPTNHNEKAKLNAFSEQYEVNYSRRCRMVSASRRSTDSLPSILSSAIICVSTAARVNSLRSAIYRMPKPCGKHRRTSRNISASGRFVSLTVTDP